MLRTALLLSLLALLAAGPTSARATHTSWPFWLSKPERHGSRKLPGDYTHHYGTYRHNSRNDSSGLFSFLRPSRRSTLARRKSRAHANKARRHRTSGIFK